MGKNSSKLAEQDLGASMNSTNWESSVEEEVNKNLTALVSKGAKLCLIITFLDFLEFAVKIIYPDLFPSWVVYAVECFNCQHQDSSWMGWLWNKQI